MDMKKLKKLVNIKNYKKLLISKGGIGILKKIPKQGKDSEFAILLYLRSLF